MILLLMFFTGFVIDGSVVLINLAAMETVSDSLSGSALGLATFSSQLCMKNNYYSLVINNLINPYSWPILWCWICF